MSEYHPCQPRHRFVVPTPSLTSSHLNPDARRNLCELTKLIDLHFEYRSRILVIRIDLRYIKEVAAHIPQHVAHGHLEQLLGDRRMHPSVFDHLLGYAWGLEWGEQEGGIHYHLLLLYDGAYRRDDIGIGLTVRDLWNQITGELGECYISNFDKEKFAQQGRLGIGMIHRTDVTKRINLIDHVAAYITKRSSNFVIEAAEGSSRDFRLFGKSRMPKPIDPNVPRRGRRPLLR
jgi:hypothetical protein